MKLYELTEAYLQVNKLIESGEATAEELADTLESITDTIDVKADNYAKIIRMQEGNINTLDAEIKRLTAFKASINSNIDKLTSNLKFAMEATGKTDIKTDLFKIKLAKNPAKLQLIDETKIPEDYFRVDFIRVLDKNAVKDAIKNGEIIEGAELIQETRVSIK